MITAIVLFGSYAAAYLVFMNLIERVNVEEKL